MKYKIAIISSRFNSEITKALLDNAISRAEELHLDYKIYQVPGAIEIPVVAEKLASARKFDAIITLGAVIRGDTSHYDYVCYQISYGCQKVAIKNHLPVIFGVLTCDNEQQAIDRIKNSIYMVNSAVEMIELMKQIDCE